MKKKIIYSVIILIGSILSLVLVNKYFPGKTIPSLFPRTGDSKVSGEYLNAQRTVEFYREQIKMSPDEPKNYVELAQVFIQEARVTGNHHEYIPKATELIEQALGLDQTNLEANLTKASILLTLHQFENAKNIGEWAVSKYPYVSDGYGILCDAYVELGEYEKAVKVCDKMLSIKPDLRSYSRASYLREIHGRIDDAIDAMKMAADAGVTGQENRAWTLYNLANLYLQTGKADTAEYIFKGILEERPYYAHAYSGLAKIMIGKKNYTGAIENLINASRLSPEHVFTEQLADIYLLLGNKEAEEKLNEKIIEAFEQHEEDGWNIDREFAQFCLIHNIKIKEAFERAEKDFKRRPNNIDDAATYTLALCKTNDFEKAKDIINKVTGINPANPLINYLSGVVYASLGENEKAYKNFELSVTSKYSLNVLLSLDAVNRLNPLKENVLASK